LITRGGFFALLIFFISPSLYSFDFGTLNKLHNNRYWHTLLHFKNGKSEIDDPKFFLSADGKYNPNEELEATITALIKNDKSVSCRFPARINWILKQLPELKKDVASYQCHEIEKILDDYKPKSVSLIFPTAHINSPASMYGHTFLRVDADKKTPLISQAVNYAAQTDETNGLIYAYQGLVGGYEGRYSIFPYYKKIKEYNDMERRDIWEYELNLSTEEIKKLMYHQYELKDIYSDYFFFTENCSYNLLWLLQAARENSRLIDRFSYKAIPIDTIRAIKDEGFIKSVNFRPSKSRKIKAIVKKIDNIKLAKRFLNDFNLTLLRDQKEQQQAYILDLSTEMLRFKRAKNKLEKKEYVKKLMTVLGARSKIDIKSNYLIKEPSKPLSGHKTSRVELSLDKEGYAVSYKPSFHDIYDLDIGYQEGAYINFFELKLRKDKSKNLKIEKFDIVNITSLSAWDELFKPISWSVRFGYGRDYNNDGGFVLDSGAGVSFEKFGFFSYLFFNPTVYLAKESLASISPKVGFIKNFQSFKFGTEIKREFLTDGSKISYHECFFTFSLKKDLALNLKYSKIDKKSLINFGLFYYF